MNSNKYIFKNRISQHLDILHRVMRLLHECAWMGDAGRPSREDRCAAASSAAHWQLTS